MLYWNRFQCTVLIRYVYLHLWLTISLPCSCRTVRLEPTTRSGHTINSARLIHSWWNVPKLAKILPPIHALYCLSTALLAADILIFYRTLVRKKLRQTLGRLTPGHNLFISLLSLSTNPGSNDPPPVSTVFCSNCPLRSGSHAAMELCKRAGTVGGRLGAFCELGILA
jgi:hypothetical protein